MYDIVFISYNEPNAEENWQALKFKFPTAKRVDGVTGIHQAHIAAAKKCFTKMFWVVDGDAILFDGFNFDYVVDDWNSETVHVWHSLNPINDLVYGYGGIKLLPRRMTIKMDTTKLDMTTSISKNFKVVPEISNITAFNTDPFSTWRSAFRECAKLASKTIQGQVDEETEQRLETWCTVGENSPYGFYALDGARAGREFGVNNKSDISLINNFHWLQQFFQQVKI